MPGPPATPMGVEVVCPAISKFPVDERTPAILKELPYRLMALPLLEVIFPVSDKVPPYKVIGPAAAVALVMLMVDELVNLPMVRPVIEFSEKFSKGKLKALLKVLLEGSTVSVPVVWIDFAPTFLLHISFPLRVIFPV